MQQTLGCVEHNGCILPVTSDMSSFISLVPEPPCMPSAMLRLELLLKERSADLGAVCDVIRNDIGLSVGMFRLSSIEEDLPTHIPEMVLCLGTDALRSWVRKRLGPSCPTSRPAMTELIRHARLVARIAEVIAPFVEGANREEVYMGGLLHDIGTLPAILGWDEAAELGTNPTQVGLSLARAWSLPDFVIDAIQPVRDSRPITPLGQVLSAAHEWALVLERAWQAGLDAHRQIVKSHPIVKHWLPSVTPSDSQRLSTHLDFCIDVARA